MHSDGLHPSSFLFLVVMPGATSSFLLLVAMASTLLAMQHVRDRSAGGLVALHSTKGSILKTLAGDLQGSTR